MRIQRQHSLDGHIYATKVVPLKHDLAHLLPVLDRVHGRLRQQDLPAGRVDLELFVKCVVPKVLHVIPFLDDTVLHRVRDLQHGARRRRLVAAHDVLDLDFIAVGSQDVVALFLGSQDRSPDYRRELVLGKVLARISDLEETGAAVEDCGRGTDGLAGLGHIVWHETRM